MPGKTAMGQGAKPMTSIYQAETEQDRALVRELFLEYLEWANRHLNREYGIDFNIQRMVEQDMAELEIFFPPHGRLLLALEGDQAVGIACMRRIREDMGEIKRMYVRPSTAEGGSAGPCSKRSLPRQER